MHQAVFCTSVYTFQRRVFAAQKRRCCAEPRTSPPTNVHPCTFVGCKFASKLLCFLSSRKAKLFRFFSAWPLPSLLILVSHAWFILLVSRGKAVLDIPSVYSSLLNTTILPSFVLSPLSISSFLSHAQSYKSILPLTLPHVCSVLSTMPPDIITPVQFYFPSSLYAHTG